MQRSYSSHTTSRHARLAVFVLLSWLATALAAPGLAEAQDAGQPGNKPVVISLDPVLGGTFGLAGTSRQGSWTPIRLVLTSSLDHPQSVLVCWESIDGDGDIAEMSREMVLNPGRREMIWLYLKLPFAATRSSQWNVQVYEVDDQGRRGRAIGFNRFGPGSGRVIDSSEAVIGVLGTRDANLGAYRLARLPGGKVPAAAHEPTNILTIPMVSDLPDRWMGLSILEALVWTQGNPQQLQTAQVEAVEEWVHRGGHLVVVLPEVGQEVWRTSRIAQLVLRGTRSDVLPWEGQQLANAASCGGLLRHISRDATVARDRRDPPYPVLNLTYFEPDASSWSQVGINPMMEIDVPLFADGSTEPRPVVIQRPVGFGQVTVIGIPLTNTQFHMPGRGFPHAEVFWNQILGRRQDIPDQTDISVADRNLRTRTGGRGVRLSEAFQGMIDLSRKASGGVLLALVVFSIYWVVAGPGGFALLKYKGWVRHSWLAYVGTAAVFTAFCWAGARMLRSADIKPKHVTVLDHVANGEYQRATTYLTVSLEGYGTRRISIGSADDEPDSRWHNALSSYDAPQLRSIPFPDQRRYQVEADRPAVLDVPARSTSKQFMIQWYGPPQSMWGMPNYLRDADRPRVLTDDTGQATALAGKLIHNLPGTLRDATIYHVENRRSEARPRPIGRARGEARLRVNAWKLPGAGWEPGTELDLSIYRHDDPRDQRQRRLWQSEGHIENLMKRLNGFGGLFPQSGSFSVDDQRAAMELLGLYRMITPPKWEGRELTERSRFIRGLAREWDASSWFNRPALIITGFVQGGPLPTPVAIDGELLGETDPRSVTFVRWFYPFDVEHEPLGSRRALQ